MLLIPKQNCISFFSLILLHQISR